MKKVIIVALLAVATLAMAAPQTTCPVMGSKIDKTQYVDVNGYRIYICCKGCAKPIKAAPDKFIAKMKKAGVDPEKVPTETPSK